MDLSCARLLADSEGLICRDRRQHPERIDAQACAMCHWRHRKPTAGLRASPDGTLPEVPPEASGPPGSRPLRGLGDAIAIVAKPIARLIGKDPNCKPCGQRQAKLNKLVPFSATPNPFPDVTFAITAFERHKHLRKLVLSIRKFYPGASIIVADNGHRKARLPADVEVVNLEFNCGLSAARNALIDRLATKYLCLLEDDFEFTAETKIESLFSVLEHHPEVGCVGGSLYNNGNLQDYAVDMHLLQGALQGVKSTGYVRVTPSGIPYRLCDKIYNFGLWRHEMLADHRWPEEIKLQEHTTYFWRVKKAGRWLVAHCPSVRANHDQGGRDKRYQHYRNTVGEYRKLWYESDGISDFIQQSSLNNGCRQPDRPNVLVMGVGHSRTTALTRMLETLGWNAGDADLSFAESPLIRSRNRELLAGKSLDETAISRQLVERFDQPWVIKDPRFVLTLDRWLAALAGIDHPPVLLWIVRDMAELEASYLRKGLLVDGKLTLDYQQGWTLPRLYAEAQRQFDLYPWVKLKITDRQLSEAAATFRGRPGFQIIPRVFHRIWLGGQPMPQEYVDFGRGWLELNPGWEMREWNESNLPELVTGTLFREARNYSQASDVLRYELLYRFGGVYLDTDFEALKPLQPLLQSNSWVGAGEYRDMVSAGFIACTAGHPITRDVLDMLPERIRGDLPQAQATGPGMLTEAWKRFKEQPGVQAYPPGLFYPYGWQEKHRRHEEFPNAVAVHHWAGSWVE